MTEYDHIMVTAGAAGCVVTAGLAQSETRILLLEAGRSAGRDPALRGTEGPVRVAPVPGKDQHLAAVAFAQALHQLACPATGDLSEELCASMAGTGVRVPLVVTLAADGGNRVVEGHRRLAAAIKTGQGAVLDVLDVARAEDEAGQYLDMVVANSDTQRRNFTPVEMIGRDGRPEPPGRPGGGRGQW